MLLDSVFVESILEDLVVLYKFVIELGIPLDLAQVESAWVNCIHHLAVNSTRRALLDFRQLQLREIEIKLALGFLFVDFDRVLTSRSSFIHSRMTPFDTKKAPSIIPIASPDILF